MILPTREGPSACLPAHLGTEPSPADVELARWDLEGGRVVLVFIHPARLDRVHVRAYQRGPGGILTEAPRGVSLTLPSPDALPGLVERAVALALGAAMEDER